ncbi:uncharacterized protein ACNLHF_028479 isoform 1-T1 [Anomaloglossus baeobatrachus]
MLILLFLYLIPRQGAAMKIPEQNTVMVGSEIALRNIEDLEQEAHEEFMKVILPGIFIIILFIILHCIISKCKTLNTKRQIDDEHCALESVNVYTPPGDSISCPFSSSPD